MQSRHTIEQHVRARVGIGAGVEATVSPSARSEGRYWGEMGRLCDHRRMGKAMATHERDERWKRRLSRWRWSKSPWKVYLLLTLMLISTVSSVRAGDLKNTGGINNRGQVRVKNAATGLPASNGGVYEFFGASQPVPGRQYVDLKLTGSGTKTADADGTVTGTLTVNAGVTYDTGPFTTHLNGVLNELGYVLGRMDRTETLTGVAGSSVFGNIGTTISWVGFGPSLTTVARKTGTALTSAATGKSSIARYDDITPAVNAGLNATLVFKYADVELGGQTAAMLSLWRSADGGATWHKQGGTVDVAQRTITKTGIQSFGRWTASDASNPLGPSAIEWVPQNLVQETGNGQMANVGTTLSPFVVQVTDGYGGPVKGVSVTFAISSLPSGATGQNLSTTTTVTDNNGEASTVLQLGNKVGLYTVSATSAGLAGSPMTFNATAQLPVSVATSLGLTSGNNQTGVAYTSLVQPYVVTVLDQYGAPLAGTAVKFALAGWPAGAVGQKLVDTLVMTNANGQAQTTLKLGTQVGSYAVTASSGSLAGSPVTFASKAVAGAAANVNLPLGTTLSGQVGQVLTPPITVMVSDAYGNPVSGVGVHYVLTSPVGATGQTPQDVTIATDSLGRSQIVLTLGSKAGTYTLQVNAGSLPPQTVTINASGSLSGAVASRLVQTTGNSQSGKVSTELADPFVVTVLDQFGNPFAGTMVTFAITGTPSSDSAAVLSSTSAVTDVNGRASVKLTLGKKVGVYTVTARSDTLSGSPIQFTAVATGNVQGVVPVRLLLTSGNGQTGQVTTQLARPFVVTVTDSVGNSVPGAIVRFALGTIPAGSVAQTLTDTVATTDANGEATTTLRLGTKAGEYTVTASSGSLQGSPATFAATALPGAASRLVMISGNSQTAPVGTTMSQPFVVQLTDAQQNVIAGTAINFAITSTPAGAIGQTLSATQRPTDSQGLASVVLTLGDKAGDYRVDASSGSITVVSFTGTATPATSLARTLLMSSGQDQRGVIRSILPQPFVVRTVDAANDPVSGISVTFALDTIPTGATGQAISTTSATTDLLGYASTELTLGDLTGVYTVRAASAGLTGSPMSLRAVATLASGACRMVYTSGDAQIGAVLSQLSSPLVATVYGADGTPVTGQTVTFAIDSLPLGSSGHSLSQISAVTNAQGQVITTMTLGNKIGVYRVSATVAGIAGSPVVYRLTSTIGLPKTLALVQGIGQSKPIGTVLDNAFVVRVTDAASNPVPGVSVAFSIDSIPAGSTGQSLRVVNSVTDAQGQAQAVLTLGNKVGSYVVSATSAGLDGSPMKFTARATAGSAALVALTSGDGQAGPVSSELLLPFVVTVTDIGGNVVQGASVQFAVETSPAGARGQTLRMVNAQTDATGQSAAYLTLGDRPGTYTVTATVSGLSLIRFSSTATVLVGDINGNSLIDIADLTTVIDYILGKITLSPSDSVKADYNKDGHIDIRDVVAMQNTLLSINVVGSKPGSGSVSSGTENIPNSPVATLADSTGQVSGEFVLTDNGIRFNLTNTVPVKGLQLVIRFKDAQNVPSPDVVFDRAKVDSIFVNSSGVELRIVVYNMSNVPIAAGDGSLFRLPVHLTDISGIASAQLVASLPNNTAYFDEAMTRNVSVRLVKPQELPLTFVLYQNYPNPFNGQTKIDYEVMDAAGMVDVTVQVYNVLGEKVKTLVTARQAGGRFTVRWDGTDDRGTKLSSGAYYYRLISGSFVSSKKMILLK